MGEEVDYLAGVKLRPVLLLLLLLGGWVGIADVFPRFTEVLSGREGPS